MLSNLKNKSEEYRRKFALGASTGIFMIMFFSWSYFNGFLGFSTPVVAQNTNNSSSQLATVVVSTDTDKKIASPFENTQNTFSGLFEEVGKQYNTLKESLSSVFVPFVTNIDVYDKTK